MLSKGDPAPWFTADTTDGRTLRWDELKGKIVVLFFFPKAFTFGCDREAAHFAEVAPEVAALGGEVLGVSVDDDSTACRFAEQRKVVMLKDRRRRVAEAYGVPLPIVNRVRRVTYVIDRAGIIRGVFHYELQFARHADDALTMVRRLAAGQPT